MKIAIYGAGSLGLILGAYITKNGTDVDLIRRDKKHIDALNKKGAQVIGKANFTQKVNALRPDEMTDKYDLIILATKQINNDLVIPFLSDYLKEDGVLATIQNGLPEPAIIKVLGPDRVVGVVVEWGAKMKGPGISELTSEVDSMSFTIGRIDGKVTDEVQMVASILELMCPTEIVENFVGIRWYKLLLNSAFGGVSSALGANLGQTTENNKSRLIIQNIAKEIIDLANIADITIPSIKGLDIVKLLDYTNDKEKRTSYEYIPKIMAGHNNSKASLLQDLEKGIPTEILYLNGVIRDYGNKYELDTPFNNKTIEIIQNIEKGNLKPEFNNIDLYEDLF